MPLLGRALSLHKLHKIPKQSYDSNFGPEERRLSFYVLAPLTFSFWSEWLRGTLGTPVHGRHPEQGGFERTASAPTAVLRAC